MCMSGETKRTPSLCPSDTAAKIIIYHWKRKTGAKIFFNGQVADDSHESVIIKPKT